jgi:putative ABC transport system substrate-binding protein
MKMKKLCALVMALAMVLSLAACGGSSAPAPAAEDNAAAGSAAASGAAEAAEAPAAAEGQTYTIGICQLVQHDALDAATKGFKDYLTEQLGDSVTFDEQNAQGDSTTCSTICTGFVSNNYDLILANATPALQAAVSATTDIPILGTSVTDYGTALSDESMDASKGTGINVSGSSDGVPAQTYADLVTELVPGAKNVSVLYCSAEANSVLQADQFKAAMEQTGATVTIYTFADSNDIQSVVTSAIDGADALYIPTDNTAASNMTIVSNVCQPAGVPVICGEQNMMMNGGLATASISYYNIGRAAGEQAYQILVEGADVATMPIAYDNAPVKMYNAEYAQAIGFTVPEGYEAATATETAE